MCESVEATHPGLSRSLKRMPAEKESTGWLEQVPTSFLVARNNEGVAGDLGC